MLKTFMVKTVVFVASLVPGLARAAIPKVASAIGAEDVAFRLITAFPVESIVASGEQGRFEGAVEDVSVIQRYAAQGTWSPKMTARIIAELAAHPGATYVDIGANIGLTAIPVAAAGISVVAFEPVPRNFGYLGRNARLNGADETLRAHNLALLDKPGEVTFELSPSNHGDHRLRRGEQISHMGENQWQTVRVTAVPLDDFLGDVGSPLIVKVDTQGSEPLVFAGGKELLARAKMVISEFSPYAMKRMGSDPEPLIAFFAGCRSVEIFNCEDEDPQRRLNGAELSDFLRDFYRKNQDTPFGKYLNLCAEVQR